MRFLITLVIFLLVGTVNSIAADCADVNGATTTISSDCSGRLEVTGDGSNITIDSGVNVSGQTSNERFAIETTDGTNTTITVNGSIGSRATSGNLERYSIYHHTGTGSITAINNNGTMGVYENGASSTGIVIHNKSTIGNINNAASGTMTSSGRNTIVNGADGVITKIDNDGTIESDNKWTIKNITGQIGEIDNSGTIEAGANGTSISAENAEAAIRNYGGEITTITNSGLITANEQTIQNSGGAVIGTINNTASGTIRAKGTDQQAIRVEDNGSIIRTIINAGTIEATRNHENADRATIRVFDGGEITTITNSGTISSLGTQSLGAIWVGEDDGTTIGTITNSGDITSRGKEGTINNHGAINTINNSNNITNTSTDTESAGIRNADSGTITTINNTGTITGANVDIRNADTGGNTGTIITLNNDQGGSDALTYSHALPTNYNVIVNSNSDYGKVTFSSVSGTTNFGVYSTSTLAEGTYSSVISGLSSSHISSGTSGTHSNSNACADVNATTVTFASNCAELDISGDGSDITIDSGVTISGVGDYDWTLNNSSGTTWDLVSTPQLDDAVNTGTNTLLNNLGTIAAAASGANGILNQGTFTTLTNSGSITSDSAHGINNTGTITTLNNLQGASSSALTYKGTLPTNYNIIVNSDSDYGKITFSNFSGSTAFGINSNSTLIKGTTYNAVIEGLESSNISSTTTSGTYIDGPLRKDWTLANSGTTWNLIVDDDEIDITPDTETSIINSVKPNITDNFNDLNSVIEVNFANMNTYDCDLFGKKNICLSLGARRTNVNNPKTATDGGVIVGGYKFSGNVRIAGFYHSNHKSSTPARFKLSDKTPLLGAIAVWNERADKMGFQIKIANAFQQKNATLTREIVGSSEKGIGKTQTEAKSIVVEFQYGYPLYDKYIVINPHLAFYTIMHPYVAFRKSENTQDAYTETGINTPITYNEIKDEMTTVLFGLKFDTIDSNIFSNNFSRNLSIKGSIGLEHDLSHSVTTLKPTGISGLSEVSLTDAFNKTRPVASIGFDYMLKRNLRFSGLAQFQELPYQNKEETNYYFKLTQAF